MPYIEPKGRDLLLPESTCVPSCGGELNYQITELLNTYLCHAGLNYNAINDILGALEGAKLEFYRRVAVPYEKTKIKANGDVYMDYS